MNRAIRAWEAFWPTLMLWLPLLSVLMLTGAEIPHGRPATPDSSDALITLGLLIFVVEFLVIKSLLMLRNYEALVYDDGNSSANWVSLSLISANLAFAIVYLIIIVFFVNPAWVLEHPQLARRVTDAGRVGLAVVLAWGGYQLLSIAPASGVDRLTVRGIVITGVLVVQSIIVFLVSR